MASRSLLTARQECELLAPTWLPRVYNQPNSRLEILRCFLSLTLSDYSLDNVVVRQDSDSLDSSFSVNFRQLDAARLFEMPCFRTATLFHDVKM